MPKNQQNNTILLKTKTYRPPIRNEFVKRQALIDLMENSMTLPLTLISAATGCGKSVTTSMWLEDSMHKYGWLSLDEEHNDVRVFIAYLASLLKEQWPDQNFGIGSLLDGVNIPPNLIATTLINDLDQLVEPFVLVLDDYHVIKEESIHEILNSILRYPPENFHLVLLTQIDPPLKLARIRAQLRLFELRMKDLAFTDDEAIELRSLMSIAIPDDEVKKLVKQSEGWITGISVGMMGLKEGITVEKVIQALHTGGSIISKLLDEVVIQGLPIESQKYLELTSLLDRFTLELIQTLISSLNDPDLSAEESSNLIKSSVDKNLFLIQLDPSGEWYRYHHLFRSQIKSRIGTFFSKELIQKLYKEASIWFQSKDLLEEALKYAILSEDMNYAVRLFDSNRIALHNSEQFQRLERLIDMFPETAIHNNVEILLSLAILQDHKANFQAMQKYLELAGKILDGLKIKDTRLNHLKGEYHSVKSYLSFMQRDLKSAIQHTEIGLELLPASEPNYFREFALAYFSMAQQAIGQKNIGLDLISRTLEVPAKSDKYFRGRLLHITGLIHSTASETKAMNRTGMQLQTLLSAQSYPSGWMAGMLAVVTSEYISNNISRVYQFHDQLYKYRFSGRPFGVIHHFFVECLASLASGDYDLVHSTLSICKELATDLDIPPLKGTVYAFEVEIALAQNNLDQAIEASALANFSPHPPIWYYYLPQLTEVKFFFNTNKQEKGLELLEELINQGRTFYNQNLLIQALALKVILLEKMGDHSLALKVLREVLKLSKNKGHIRAIVDHGDIMKQLLREISKEQTEMSQIRELVQAFSGINPEKTNRHTKGSKPLIGYPKLSKRELEILYLVTQGYKNDEIADKIFISLDTVKKHLYNTYQKLCVKNRVAAIKKAQELGLLASE